MLASSPTLEQAIQLCRDASPANNPNYAMPVDEPGECDSLTAALTGGELEVFVSALMGMNADGASFTPLLPEPTSPITNRWIYADFGRNSAQLALPDDVRGLVQELGMGYGLLRADWQGQRLNPTMLLNPTFEDGLYIYQYEWAR